MTDEDWWTWAVAEFGIDAPPEAPAMAFSPPVADPTSAGDAAKTSTPRRRRRMGLDLIVIAVVAIGAALLLRTFVVQQFAVDGQSMLGTLHSGDRVIVNKLSYDFHDPRHGDIVVLEDPNGSFQERDLIKRVVGLPGETLEYRGCQLFIDGERVNEPYLDPALVTTERCGISQAPVEVAAGHVFVMGDNRDASLDSRIGSIGQIPYDHLIGRAVVIVWPQSEWRWL
ncbi:MAG TPA: signal peptidase I [Ilumatobacteraceae bacterium]|jgi:signal peptidase I